MSDAVSHTDQADAIKKADSIADAADAAAKEKQLEEDLQRAQESGWKDRIPYEYDEPSGEARVGITWLSQAAVYEWNDEFGEGDIGPPNEALEKELFEDPNMQRTNVLDEKDLKALQFNVDVNGVEVFPFRRFTEAGLHPNIMNNVRLCKYLVPTPIQAYTIPAVLMGHDVVGIAQTGSGKTAAFLLPILSKLMGKARILAAPRPNPSTFNRATDRVRAEPLVLVVCPTRELACQIFDEARRLCYRTMLRPCVIYGGAPTKNQREQLEMGCDILVATPGRLMDFMGKSEILSLKRLKFTVIDEADELLSGGWEDVLDKLFSSASTNMDADNTVLMFSATFPKEARKLMRDYMAEDCVRIKVGRLGSTHNKIEQTIIYVDDSMKNQALFDLLHSTGAMRTLVFVNSKFKCDQVDDFLYNRGLPSTSMHSDRTQREREDALRAFRTGKCPIMVTTGVSARGLDVAFIKHVINYDLPSTQHDGITEYIHRIGRTGRIGGEGKATSFYNDRNEDIAPELVKLLLENKQPVPDFLDIHKPTDPENIEWRDGTDDESEVGDFGDFTIPTDEPEGQDNKADGSDDGNGGDKNNGVAVPNDDAEVNNDGWDKAVADDNGWGQVDVNDDGWNEDKENKVAGW